MDAIFAPFTPMFEPFLSLCRTHANAPARKQTRSTAHPHGLPSDEADLRVGFSVNGRNSFGVEWRRKRCRRRRKRLGDHMVTKPMGERAVDHDGIHQIDGINSTKPLCFMPRIAMFQMSFSRLNCRLQ